MKKKILSICLAAVIAVMAIAGASLAYFTDTDSAENVLTVGNVKIQLIEQQRDGNGGLEEFEDEKLLMPIVGSVQTDAKDKYGLSTSKNYVDKIVTVKNTGKSAAYVRVLVAVPTALLGDTAADDILHSNFGDKFRADGKYDTTAAVQPTNTDYSDKVVIAEGVATVTIDDIEYRVDSYTYTDALASEATTKYASLVGFYLDKRVGNTYVNDELKYTFDGTVIEDYDFSEGVTIPVYAQAIQAAGFSSAADAFAASGLSVTPW